SRCSRASSESSDEIARVASNRARSRFWLGVAASTRRSVSAAARWKPLRRGACGRVQQLSELVERARAVQRADSEPRPYADRCDERRPAAETQRPPSFDPDEPELGEEERPLLRAAAESRADQVETA